MFFVINFYGQEISWNYDDNYKNTGSKVFSTSLSQITNIINQNKLSFNLPIPISPRTTKNFSFTKSNVLSSKLADNNNIRIYRAVSDDDKIKVYINLIDDKSFFITIINENVKITLNNSLEPDLFIQNVKIEPESNKFLKFDDENCGIDSQEQQKKNSTTNNLDPVGETPNLIKYRIAVIPSSEWSNYFINEYNAQDLDNSKKRSIVLGEIGVTLTEINSIYERDLGVTFELIENNEFLIEFDTTKDGITHYNKGKQLSESINILNNVIGFNNYDIGHVFDAANYGGVAYLNALCGGLKAGGVSGSGTPNDNFFMHVVAHEIGHQFGAYHTFNSNVGSGTNRVEPGAGTTIMGYREAGEYNQYFHAKSIKEMTKHMRNTSCGVLAENFSNQSPNYKNPPNKFNYTIPTGTPFLLGYKIEIEDPDNEETQLLYSWEQMDGEKTLSPPVNTSLVGPMFRSIFPNNEIVRSFPDIETVANGDVQNTWEVIPQLTRQMNFTFTVRDDNDGGGSVMQEDYVINAEFSEDGAFTVLSQKVNDLKYHQDEFMEVVWNHLAAKNSTSMDIELSLDGGYTFPIKLISNTPNDGIEKVKVPNYVKTKNGRVRVMPSDNIFYSINTADFEIIDPKLKLNIIYPEPIQCFGETTEIKIDPVGGAGGPYTIVWEKFIDNVWVITNDEDNDPKILSNLNNGEFRVSLKDKSNNQLISSSIFVKGPTSSPVIDLLEDSKLEINCHGEKDAYVSVKMSGGVSPYTLLLNNNVILNNLSEGENYKIYNLSAADYSLKIIDDNGCISENRIFTVEQPNSALEISNFSLNNSTSEDGNGSITLDVNGGTKDYIFEWTSSIENYTSSEKDIDNLKAGEYFIKITDSKGCFIEQSFEVENKDDFNFNLSITNILCKGSNTGEIITNPSGGKEPYNILFYDSDDKLISDSNIASNLKSGNYKLLVTDDEDVEFPEKIITISEPEQTINLSLVSKNNIKCFGEENANFEIDISGGIAPYSYYLNNELFLSNSGNIETNEDNIKRSELKAGIYEVLVIDSNNCSNLIEVIIESPQSQIEIINSEINNVSKYNFDDGSISLDISGGTLNKDSNYIFTWSGPENYNSDKKNIENLKPGKYTLIVQDDNNCLLERTFEIKTPEPFSFESVVGTNPICFDGTDGSITIEYSGGYGKPYTVNWYKKDINNDYKPITSTSNIKNKLDGIKAGTYRIEILDSNGISYLYENDVIIDSIDEFKVELPYSITPESCAGQADGSFSIKINGGTAPYSYYFDEKLVATDRGNIITNSDDFSLDNLESNVYTFYSVDKNGCISNVVNINITGNQPITIANEPVAVNNISCFGAKDGSINVAIVGGDGSGDFNYSWSGPNNFSSDSKNISNLEFPGKYVLNVKQSDCEENFEFTVTEPTELQAKVVDLKHYNCNRENPFFGSYKIQIEGGTPPYFINGEIFGVPGISSYTVNYSRQYAGVKNHEIKDSNECKIITLNPEILAPESILQIEEKVINSCESGEKNKLEIKLTGGTPFQNPNDVSEKFYNIKLSGPNYEEKFEVSQGVKFLIENLDSGNYYLEVEERDFMSSSESTQLGCRTGKSIFVSSTIVWSGKFINDIKCNSNQNLSNDGDVEYKQLRGGSPFIKDDNTKYYKYDLVLDNALVESGEVNANGDIKLEDLEKGNYIIKFIDQNDCIISDNFTIDNPAPLEIKFNEIIKACNSANLTSSKGGVNFNIRYGNAPYEIYIIDDNNETTFSGLKGGNADDENTKGYTETLQGLSVGKYKLKVIDDEGCELISDEFEISVLPEFKVDNLIFDDVECYGEQSGKVVIGSVDGGRSPYNVVLQSSNYYYERSFSEKISNFSIENLPSGNYNITIQDSEGNCGTFFEEFIISEPDEIKVNFIEKSNQSCYDSPDGKVSIDIEGGSLSNVPVDYKISWFKDNVLLDQYENALSLNNLGYGFYQVSVSAISIINGNEVECVSDESFQIERPDGLYASEVLEKHVDVDCHAGSNGQFEVYFIGGVGPYSVSVNGSIVAENIFENFYKLTELKGGKYIVDIIDANGCKFSESSNSITGEMNSELLIEIEQPEKVIDVDIKTTNVSCFGSSDGIVEVYASGGKGPYSINWLSDVSYEVIESDNEKGFFKIKSGSGKIYANVVDATNYCGTAETQVEVAQPAELKITEVNKQNNICYGEENGKFEIFISGDKSIYNHEIKWFYYDNEKYVEINNQNKIDISNDRLTASSMPNGKYKIEVERSHFRNFENGERIICDTSLNFEITSNDLFTIEEDIENHQNITCDSNQGSIIIDYLGGVAPFKLSVNNLFRTSFEANNDRSLIVDNLFKGENIITIEDSTGCVQTITTTIQELEPIFDIEFDKIDTNKNNVNEGNPPTCYDGLGTFEFKIMDNQSAKPLRYMIDDKELEIDKDVVALENTMLVKNISVGRHKLKIIDEFNACRVFDFEILNSEKIRFKEPNLNSYIESYISCADEQDNSNLNLGIIDITNSLIGGNPFNNDQKYIYKWSGPNFSSDESRILVTEPGFYNLEVVDSKNCSSEIFVFDLNIDEISSNTIIENLGCNTLRGSLTADPSGGNGPYDIVWYKSNEDGDILEQAGIGLKIDNLPVGYYISKVTDFNGCDKLELHHLIDEKVFTISEPTITESLCLMESGSVEIKIYNPYETDIEFIYNNENLSYSIIDDTDSYTRYQVQVNNPVEYENLTVRNNFGCTYDYLLNLGIGVADFKVSSNGLYLEDFDKIAYRNNSIVIENNSEGKYHSVGFDLDDGTPEIIQLRDNENKIIHSYKEEGYYVITLKLYNRQGCYKEIKKTLLVGKGYTFEVPNAFTPNNDGINDFFRPIISGIVEGEFNVYDINGNIMYVEKFNIQNDLKNELMLDGWDGINRKRGDKIYYYKFKGYTIDDFEVYESGHFSIIE